MKNLRLPKQITGVIITEVENGSPAGGVLVQNDVIMEINRTGISNVKDFEKAVSGVGPDQNLLLLIYRDGFDFLCDPLRAIIPCDNHRPGVGLTACLTPGLPEISRGSSTF